MGTQTAGVRATLSHCQERLRWFETLNFTKIPIGEGGLSVSVISILC